MSAVTGSTWMYRLLLKSVQSIRRRRRRMFRLLPRNARRVLSKILGYVNFFRLIPVVAAMALVPRHFFRNLRAILRGGNPLYLMPAAVLTSFAALIFVLAGLLGVPAFYWWIAGALGIIALLGPIWAIMCALMVRGAKRMDLPSLFPWLLWSDDWEDVLLSRDAFKRLNKGMYVQGLLYFTIYFLLTMPLVLLMVLARMGIPALADLLQDMDQEARNKVADGLKLPAVALAGWIASWTIVRPLGILFVSCVDVPGRKFYEVEFGRLKDRIESAYPARDQQEQKPLEELRKEWKYVVAELLKQELRVRVRCPDRMAEMLADRSSAASEIIGLLALLDENRDADMLKVFRRLSRGEPIRARQTASA